MIQAQNPLLDEQDIPRYELIRPDHISGAVDILLAQCEEACEEILGRSEFVDFNTLASSLDGAFESLGFAWGTVQHLQSVCDTPELRAAIDENHSRIAEFSARHASDARLYERYKTVLSIQGSELSHEQRRSIELALQGMCMSGAELGPDEKDAFSRVQQDLMLLGRTFGNQLLDATDAFVHWASREEASGIPDSFLEGMIRAAENEGRQGAVKVTLQQPSLVPVLKYASNRELRERVYRAHVVRASEFGTPSQDNGPVINKTMALRQKSAEMLGYANFAEVSLVPKMASSPQVVMAFLQDLSQRSREKAEAELKELRAYAKERLGLESLEAWDLGFVSEHLRQERYEFSEQEVMRYFQLDKVLAGLFSICERLYGITIRRIDESRWHTDVTAYSVERKGNVIGKFLLDPFARPGKQGGAWMNGIRPRWRRPDGVLRIATAYLVTNSAPPVTGKPALLTHSDVVTLFHEFGHCFHFLLSTVDVLGVSGISGVEWDAVELPSQLMENYAWDWLVLSEISSHCETGEPLPRALYDRMIAARQFQGGLNLLRQVELSLFDMRLHNEPDKAGEVQKLLDEIRSQVSLFIPPDFNRFQNGFSHIFAGGYAAGYYSYLWAEVLACDAWERFSQAGGVNPQVGEDYRKHILSVGGSRSMNESFEKFMGRAPTIDALLRQRGLLDY